MQPGSLAATSGAFPSPAAGQVSFPSANRPGGLVFKGTPHGALTCSLISSSSWPASQGLSYIAQPTEQTLCIPTTYCLDCLKCRPAQRFLRSDPRSEPAACILSLDACLSQDFQMCGPAGDNLPTIESSGPEEAATAEEKGSWAITYKSYSEGKPCRSCWSLQPESLGHMFQEPPEFPYYSPTLS